MIQFDNELRARYARNLAVPGIGEEGQRRLFESSVAIIGCGALGSVCANYLTSAGVGWIGLADFDVIDISNLQRQVFYAEEEVGLPKAKVLAGKLRRLNSAVAVETVEERISAENAPAFLSRYDFILDATDNPSSKHLVDEVCVALGKPYSIGGVAEMRGQVMTHLPQTARFCDVFPGDVAGYAPPGVVGPMPGIIGSILAMEAIKYITHAGRLLTDRMLVFDAATMTPFIYDIER